VSNLEHYRLNALLLGEATDL